jgi:hypothetical protein
MPTKKTPRSTANFLRKPRPAPRTSKFPCPNPGDPLTVKEIVARMQFDSDFAEFISRLLCASYTDDKAKACLASYYQPTNDELTSLCIPKEHLKNMGSCTVPDENLLIAVPARYFSQPGT